MDDKYAELEVPICDVKDIQNTQKGVSGFWLRAMVGNKSISGAITEKDRPILAYLEDIKLELHEKGQGYTLTFIFEKNGYFDGTVLTKKFVMSKANVIEKSVGTEIKWTAGSNPTKEKKKKKIKAGGKKKTVTKEVKCDSFFNFFETVELKEKVKVGKDDKGSDDEESEDDIGEKMDEDFEFGNEFKDDLIPLALEYYLGVIEQESGDEDDSDEDGGDGDKDSDEDEKPKKKGKKGGKGGAAGGAPGGKQEECKQQ